MESVFFTKQQLELAQTTALGAVQRVSSTLCQNLGAIGDLKHKGDPSSIVTYWDSWAQQEIIDDLSRFEGSIGFRGEEDGVTTEAEKYWAIDPIDGTLFYSRGVGENCHTAVALMERRDCTNCPDKHTISTPVVSVIHNFASGRSYSATCFSPIVQSQDAQQILTLPALHVSAERTLIEVYADSPQAAGQFEDKLEVAFGTVALRRYAASKSLLDIANGKQDALFVLDNPYTGQHDVAPGALLVTQAGGEARTAGRHCFSVVSEETTHKLGDIIISNGRFDAAEIDRLFST
jgi:fructose-1,6-bisphosphatase/inositol monophosphatase family enzyme